MSWHAKRSAKVARIRGIGAVGLFVTATLFYLVLPLFPALAVSADREQKGAGAAIGTKTPASQYCSNIANAARDARYAWQARELAELEGRIKERIAKLQRRTGEFKEWLARRDAFLKKARENLVSIYTGMRREAAAAQLAAIDPEMAAAVLAKLKPRVASAILNEMNANRAAPLIAIVGGSAGMSGGARQ